MLWETSKTIWTPEGEYEDLGCWSKPFSLSVPADAIDKARSTQRTKEWNLVWKLDLVVEHKPIQFVGHSISKTYHVNLYNHTSPSLPPPSPPQAISIGHDVYSTQVFMNPPHGSFGPGDKFAFSFYAKPDDPSVTVRKASVVLERRIEARDRSPSPPSSSGGSAEKQSSSSLFRRNLSPRPLYGRISSASSESEKDKAIVNKILDQTTDEITPGSGGTHWCTMNLGLTKRAGHWDIGETCRTETVSVSFELKVKIWLKSGRSTREFHCPPVPLLVVGVSAAERMVAQNAALAHVTPHKRKHRSSRRGLYMHEGTLDISQDLLGAGVVHRRKPKSKSDKTTTSPILPITGIVTDIRPILRPSDPTNPRNAAASTSASPSPPPPPQPSISFVFPSILGGHPETPVLPPIQSILDDPPAPSYQESYSILKQYQTSGRRISNTTSEEDEQPSRSRLKLDETSAAATTEEFTKFSRGLPSLDALGLGLPFVPDDRPRSRPRTAPMVSTFSRNVPPPLSGPLSSEVAESPDLVRPMSMATSQPSVHRAPSGTFAFGLPTVPGPPQRPA